MKTKNNNTEMAAAAPGASEHEYEYFDMIAKKYAKYPPLPELDAEEYRRTFENGNHPATEPKLPPDEEAEYFRRLREFTERRREAGLKIDPETAEICVASREAHDPYGIDPLFPRQAKGARMKTWFVRSPGSDIWVWDGDLPDTTVRALAGKYNPCVSRRAYWLKRLLKPKTEEPFDDEMPF